MSVKIYYKPNTLQKDGSFVPSITKQSLITQEDLLAYMAKDTALEVRDMRSTLESFEMALKFFLSMGFRIETPLGSFGLKAKGRVETEEEAFRPDLASSGHELALTYRPHAELKSYFGKNAMIEHVAYEGPVGAKMKKISNLNDPDSPSFIPGQIVEIRGLRLGCDLLHENRDEGVFWIAPDGAEHKAELLIRNTELVIQTQVPFLTAGEYHLEIRNRNRKTTLFTNRWEDTLTIEV
jgi:hypothetical protein